MQFIAEIGIVVLTAFLSFSNSLATLLTPTPITPHTSEVPTFVSENTPGLQPLDSDYSASDLIPDILITNASFQSASVSFATPENDPTATPTPLEEAVVNIFCTYTTDNVVRTTTGSGFFISPQGAILTNAHVAQFLLLQESQSGNETRCVIRTGATATALYEAQLLYVPPSWVNKNAHLINVETPTGTGERDFALLYASASVTSAPMPARFPYLTINTDELQKENIGATVHAAGYPAQPLYENGIDADLLLKTATSTITDLFTYQSTTADLFSLYDSSVSAGGSSGGPVVDETGAAIGVIATRGETANDSLRALTLAYVNRTIAEETGFGINDYVRGDLALRARVFTEALTPFLRLILERELAE